MLAGLALIPILGKITHVRFIKLRDKLREKLREDLVWGGFIDYFLEAYLVMALTALIVFSDWHIKNFGEGVDRSVACACAALMLCVPLFKLIFLFRNRASLEEEEFEEKFGALYEQLRFRRTKWALLEPFLSDCRRLALALTFVLLQGQPTFQLMSVCFQMIGMIIFLGQVEPYAEKRT